MRLLLIILGIIGLIYLTSSRDDHQSAPSKPNASVQNPLQQNAPAAEKPTPNPAFASWKYWEDSDKFTDEKHWKAVNHRGDVSLIFACIGAGRMGLGLAADKEFSSKLTGSLGIRFRLDRDAAQDMDAVKWNDKLVLLLHHADVRKMFNMIEEHERMLVRVHSLSLLAGDNFDYDFKLDGWMEAKQYLLDHCAKDALSNEPSTN